MKSGKFTISAPWSQLADELRRRIRTGEISGRMPGLRSLMAEFSLSRTVVEGALAELAKSGDALHQGPNKAMLPVKRRDAAAPAGTLLVFDRPPEKRGGEHAEIFLAIEAGLPAPVTRLRLDSHTTDPEPALRRILESPQRRIVIMDLRAEIADRLVEAGRLVVTAGVAGTPTRASSIAVSHEALVRGAVAKAFAAGHRRVSFPLWRRKSEVAEKMRAWIADEYAKAGYRHSPEFDAPVVPEHTPESLHSCLRALLRHTPPTAIISSDFRQWLGTVTALGAAGLRIPREVSLITLGAGADWDTATPSPAHFRYPVPAFVKATQTALADAARGRPPKAILLDPIWVPGDSLGPAPK